MEKRKIFASLIFVCIIMISFTSAITGSIGNAKMILRAETGDTIEKYVLVKNINNVSVNVELSASGDLSEDIEILDETFSLGPGEKKKAQFIVDVKKVGTTQGTIDIKFTPAEGEGKNGVGLMSTVIVIAEKGSWFGSSDDKKDDKKDEGDGEGIVSTITSITGNAIGSSDGGDFMITAVMVLVIFVLLLMIIVVAVMKRNKIKGKIQ